MDDRARDIAPAAQEPVPYLSGLTDIQRAAVEATEGPVLVLAGAGTGKTRVLTTRLAHILRSGRAWPSQVLAVTFTNKAAREMRERVAQLIGASVEGLWIGTFHATGARILRRHAELVGLKSNFTILDADDQLRLVKQLLESHNIDDKRWPARAALEVIQRWKDRGLGPEKLGAGETGDFAAGRAVELYRDYQARLVTLNAADFGDLLLHNLTLFQREPDVLASYQRQFRYVLVDEYQDTNVAQYLWLRLLAQGHRNLCCVGDDDQSIYSWRGAEVGNILRFEKDFPGAQVIRLEQNFRSTRDILGAASGLIANNESRLGKTLWTERADTDKVIVRGVWDGESEARMVGEEIERLHREGTRLDDVAILVRAGFQMREFEERFVTLGIPYRVVGGPRFYERQEIRDAIAYLRVVNQPDDGLAFERIVNVPRRGIGEATMQAIHRLARARSRPLVEAARALVDTDEIKPQARAALRRLLDAFDRWRALTETTDHVTLAETVLDESGYTAMWHNDKSPEAPGRLENLKELITALQEFENLAGFLEHVSLVMDQDTGSGDAATLMTLHAAKGLEFVQVFLPGWEDGLFPNQRAIDQDGAAGLEEERRLAYVGLTRAKRHATISFAANRRIYNQWQSALPSRFIEELPRAHVAIGAAPGLYRMGAGSKEGAAWDDDVPGRGPGFRRMHQAARGAGAPLLEGRASVVQVDATSRHQAGERVFHQKFGYGRVIAVEGNKLEIAFDASGTKKVVDSFVERA
ncbi:MAG: DNA helicase II [Alphaproteobacteria bacterium]|nr:DNA helicase II [Alphaproteobacteria bacterium]